MPVDSFTSDTYYSLSEHKWKQFKIFLNIQKTYLPNFYVQQGVTFNSLILSYLSLQYKIICVVLSEYENWYLKESSILQKSADFEEK